MAKLNAARRNKLPSKDFAGPGRSYPIEDKAHAKDALARAAHNASPEERKSIAEKVHRKFPGMQMKSEGHSKGRTRKSERRKSSAYKRA